jgi:hypothetical protein
MKSVIHIVTIGYRNNHMLDMILTISIYSSLPLITVGSETFCWKCRPQKWPRGEEWSGQEILYCRVGEGESWEPRERTRKGKGLNTLQWDSAWSDWLGSYGSCWLEVGAEGGFKLDLRQDRDPGKQKLKGAGRTETYQCHYCLHSSLFLFVKEGGVVLALASSSWQGAA